MWVLGDGHPPSVRLPGGRRRRLRRRVRPGTVARSTQDVRPDSRHSTPCGVASWGMRKSGRFGYGDASHDDPDWLPSPADWEAPEGLRAGKDWVPPGGARERLDRMPGWVRAWSRFPLRPIGRFEAWLWEHGGYDVEGARATEEREGRSAAYEALEAVIRPALDHAGPWPAATTVRRQNVEILDVDQYKGFAVVLSAVAEDVGGHGPMLRTSLFRRIDTGWRSQGGGGSGWGSDPLLNRQRWRPSAPNLSVSGTGRRAIGVKRRSTGVCHATVLCSPAVSTVIVDRPGDRRTADVSKGSGWIGMVWPEGFEPTVAALDEDGIEVGAVAASQLQYKRGRPAMILRRRR